MATLRKRGPKVTSQSAASRTLFPVDAPHAANGLSEVNSELYSIHHTDAFDWLIAAPKNSIHAVVTDPPYGLLEYTENQLAKRRRGKGGVWRIPPSFDGCQRSPLPRFTVLGPGDHERLRDFFTKLATELLRVLVPGAHVFIATNPLVSHLVYEPFRSAGFEVRGEIIRLVQTLRGRQLLHALQGREPLGLLDGRFHDVLERGLWIPASNTGLVRMFRWHSYDGSSVRLGRSMNSIPALPAD